MPGRITSALSTTLEQKIKIYTAAATAAGIGLLAPPEPAHARIIYHKSDVVIGAGIGGVPYYQLDVNNDGHAEVSFLETSRKNVHCPYNQVGTAWNLFAQAGYQDGLAGKPPAALSSGATIDSKHQGFYAGRGVMAYYRGPAVWCRRWGGNWFGFTGGKDAYLGLQFQAHSKTHFGWVRIAVDFIRPKKGFRAVISGFAYETKANKPIIAGDKGTGANSLGHLALGAAGKK